MEWFTKIISADLTMEKTTENDRISLRSNEREKKMYMIRDVLFVTEKFNLLLKYSVSSEQARQLRNVSNFSSFSQLAGL